MRCVPITDCVEAVDDEAFTPMNCRFAKITVRMLGADAPMNANVMKTNNGKLLAAIVAMLMIVCAVAVVASPISAADEPTAPVFSGDRAVAVNVTEGVTDDDLEALFDGAATVTENRTNYYDNGVLTVPTEGMIINLAANMGSETAPLDLKILLNGDLKIISTNGSQVWINTTTNSGDNISNYTVEFGAADSVLQIDGDVTVNLNNSITGTLTGSTTAAQGTVFSNMYPATNAALYVTGGATLNVTQNASGSTWLNSDGGSNTNTWVVVTGTSTDRSSLNFTNTNSIQGFVLDADYADITVDDAAYTGLVLKAGTTLNNSTINVDRAGDAGILIKGDVSLVSSEITTTNTGDTRDYSGIEFSIAGTGLGTGENAPGLNLDADSAITTSSFGFGKEWQANPDTVTSIAVSITGNGTVTGNLEGARNLAAGDSGTPTYTVDGITLGNTTASKGTAVTIGATGVSATGEVNLSNANVNGSGKLVATNGSTVTVDEESGKLPEYLVTVPGANVNGSQVTSDGAANKVTVTNAEQLVNYAKNDGMDITINWQDSKTLTSDLIIGDNTKITSTGGIIRLADSGTAADGTSFKIVKEGDGEVSIKVDSYTGTERSFFELKISGEFTIERGSVYVNGSLVGDDNVVTIRAGDFKISGDLSGHLVFKISGTDATAANPANIVFEDFTVNAGATLELLAPTSTDNNGNGNIVYSTLGDFNLYGSIIANAPVTLTVGTSTAESDFTAFAGAVIQQNVTLVNGGFADSSINLDDSLRTMEISVDVTGHQVYSQMQTVVIITSLDITPYATLEIMGELIVNEGVTLTVQENGTLIVNSAVAKMIVNGEIVVDNKGTIQVSDADSVTVTGSITSDGEVTINSDVTIEENGKVTIQNGANSSISVTGGLTIDAGGELEVRGQMTITPDTVGDVAISNYGTITLNGAKIMDDSTINMAADGAVVNIVSFTGAANAKLTIADNGLVLEDVRNSDKDVVVGVADADDYRFNYPGTNEISFTSTYNDVGIRNITITEVVTSERDDNDVVVYDYGMNIAGSPTVLDDTTSESGNDPEFNDLYTITLNGVDMRVAADTSLTLGTGITLENKKTLNVAGAVYAISGSGTEESKVANSGTINVTGTIETLSEIENEAGVNAAKYDATVSGATHYYYTTLNGAVAAGAEDIEVLGNIKITESLTIPSPVEVSATTGATMQIGDEDNRDVTVTVENGATIKNFRNITVDGTLSFANSRDNKTNTIISDVTVTNDPAVSYTNIYTALNNAENGDTVTISRTSGNVVLNADIEVKEGVTLVIPNSKTVEFNDDVTMTVNGTVRMLGDIVSTSTDGFYPYDSNNDLKDEYASIVVNGAILSLDQLPYATDATEGIQGYYIPGAYYNVVNSTGDYWYVTPVEQAAAVSNDVRYGEIFIYGDNTVGDIAFTGDEDQPVEVELQTGASLTAGTITLSYATLIVTSADSEFTGTVANTVGSVDLDNVRNITVADVYDDETELITVAGAPAKADDKGADPAMTIVTGNVTVNGDLNVNGLETFEIASGATMTVTGAAGKITANEMTVNGTLVSIDNGTVDVNTLTVRGTFTVSEKTTDYNAGKADINVLFVGIAQDEDYSNLYGDASAATVTADNLGNYLSQIVVSADSTVTGKLIDGMDSTEFFVEDALWITVYVNDPTSIYNYQPGDLTESSFAGWNDSEGKPIDSQTTANVGDEKYLQVYANIDYDVYLVVVHIDNGIGDVAIDGQLLVYNSSLGGYVLPGTTANINGTAVGLLDAGQHTITYTLKPNYEGTPTLASSGVNATVSGLTFTLSGNYLDDTTDYYNVNSLNLTGTTPADSTIVIDGGNGGSDMGLTDYLLIVLVILIVIMAIIVALRLMRS